MSASSWPPALLRRAVLLSCMAVPLAAATQTAIIAVPPSQCVWHAGDDLRWAAPYLDESGWLPYTAWKLDSHQPRIWIRCRADLFPLTGAVHPAIQIRHGRAFQAFLNGDPIGAEGSIASGWYTQNAAPTLPIPAPATIVQPAAIALRITYRNSEESTPVEIVAGDRPMLTGLEATQALRGGYYFLPVELCFIIIGVAGFMLLGMYLNDRSRLEFLLLAIYCWCQSINRTTQYCSSALIPIPWALEMALLVFGQALALPMFWFIFRLARKPVPWLFRVLIALSLARSLELLLVALPPHQVSLRLSAAFAPFFGYSVMAIAVTSLAAPLVAFWPFTRIPKRMRALALCCLLWGFIEGLWLAVVLIGSTLSAENAPGALVNPLLLARAFTTLLVIVALIALLFRDQRRTAEDRAQLAGEMHAAQAIQQMLVLPNIKTIPGLRIDVAFRPMSEVGGDFYICRILPGNRQRVILGDVSGKGAAAAMTASVLIGAAGCRDDDSPAELLRHMNLVLCDTRVGGFATCLCADFALSEKKARTMTIATAGHIPPWRREEEVPLEPGLPLGVNLDEEYRESTFALIPGDIVTFVSDGVVEARDPRGVLFGFDRAEMISGQSAQAIADAAQRFGQEDDITVLQLRLAITEFQFS